MIRTLLEAIDNAPLPLLGTLLFAASLAAGIGGHFLRQWINPPRQNHSETQESYVVTAVIGLLGLLLGFTLALTVDRYETRRELVINQANAIETAYLRVQLLPEPHRARLSRLLVDFVDNRVVTTRAFGADRVRRLADNERLMNEIWAATAAAFDSIRTTEFSIALVEPVNKVVEYDAARRASRDLRVPMEISGVLLLYVIVTAGVLGYVLTGQSDQIVAVFLLILLTVSLLLLIDIDRPTVAGIRAIQGPMEELRATLKRRPPAIYDKWRTPAQHPQ